MAQSYPDAPPPRAGMMPENVFILVAAALVVGLLLGQAVGRRQGMEVKQVVMPDNLAQEAAAHADEANTAETEAELAATAPKAPESLEEARAMVAQMGMADANMLLDLGRRKLGNDVNWLALGFLEKAVEIEPQLAEAWGLLGRGYAKVGHADEAKSAYGKYLALAPDGELADEAQHALGTTDHQH